MSIFYEIEFAKLIIHHQTLKTMIHEVAHSKLHSKEVEQDEQMKKDHNTKEVEAESVAYTVCQHFGVDTSDYSFGYIAGWSSGKDTKELRSSMDTIRRTASELITGIEEQLQELQRDREVSQEQTKECILLIQNTDLSEFSLLDVYGMDRLELMQALSEMTEDNKLSIQAYLESKGAWTTEIGNQDSREYGEYHLDVRYNTDTDELIDVKERKAIHDKAMQEELSESDSNRKAQLLYGNTDKYGIYQLKDDPELDKFRFEGTESLKRMGITKDNLDAVLPENYELVYMGELAEMQGQTQSETLEAIYTKLNVDHPADYKAHSLSVSDIVVLNENGENSAHFVDSFGFTELPKFMLTLEGKENAIETELAVHIADRYILMHECNEGYDYSILDEQYHLLDGGVYDNPDITIQRAMDMVIADLKEPRFSAVTEQYYRDEYLQGEVYAGSEVEIVDYEELSEKAEEVEQADLAAQQADFRENNPDVVADFRAKTEELFHSLDGQSAEDIEKTVYAYVQSQIDEYGLDAEIVDG